MTIAKCGCWVDLSKEMHWCEKHNKVLKDVEFVS